MPTTSRDDLLNEARRRGTVWGQHVELPSRFPSMYDPRTHARAYELVADILPVDSFAEVIVEACYAAAREAFNAKRRGFTLRCV